MSSEKPKSRLASFSVYVTRGLIAIGAPAITYWLVSFLAGFTDGIIGNPVRLTAGWLLPAQWAQSPTLGFVYPYISLVVSILLAAGLGVITSFRVGKQGLRIIDYIFLLIPGVASIYRNVRKTLEILGDTDGKAKFSRTVFFGPVEDRRLGFVAAETTDEETGRNVLVIFQPIQLPNPFGGKVRFIPEELTVPSGLTLQESARLVVSMGAASPRTLKVLTPYLVETQQ